MNSEFFRVLRIWLYKFTVQTAGLWASAETVGCHGIVRPASTAPSSRRMMTNTICPGSHWISSRVIWSAICNLLLMRQPYNYILHHKITLHLSNWIMLHFIMLILDMFSSHFKNLNNRHSSQLWEVVYEEKQLSKIRFLPWRHLPSIRLRRLTRGLSASPVLINTVASFSMYAIRTLTSLRVVLAHGTLASWLVKKKPSFQLNFKNPIYFFICFRQDF